jgi:hypothetical protein
MNTMLLSQKLWKEALRQAWTAYFEERRYPGGSGKRITKIDVTYPAGIGQFVITFEDGSQRKVVVGEEGT